MPFPSIFYEPKDKILLTNLHFYQDIKGFKRLPPPPKKTTFIGMERVDTGSMT